MIEASPCDHSRLLGPARYHTPQERDWYERHEPWLWDQLERGSTEYADEPAFVINCALEWLHERAEPGREPRWQGLNVRDLLLNELPMAGMLDCMGTRDVLVGLREFINWMGQHDKLDAGVAADLVQQVDASQELFLDYFGDTEPGPLATRPLQEQLAELEEPDEAWLYCLHCNRFFQARDLQVDFLGNRQGCAYSGCGAAGFDVDILRWDAFRNNRDPRWPASPDKLSRGMEAPQGPPESIQRMWAAQDKRQWPN